MPGFTVSSGSDISMVSVVAAEAQKGCGMDGCDCAANWQKFKKDPTYDNYMRAHRVKVGKMEAVAPPGFGGTVRHMAKDHKEISNPHALAWYMYEKGDKSHKKAPKGTGAEHVSKEVKEKRSKALKASGSTVSGYVESPVAKKCGTCEYLVNGDLCKNKVVAKDPKVKTDKASGLKTVCPEDGCCNEWEPKEE